jgi:hypothetical protein
MANDVDTPDTTRRWDTDERGRGVADAAAVAPRIEALAEHARRPEWVTEDATAHLWHHVERAIEAEGSPWRAMGHEVDEEGRLVIELEHAGAGERLGAEGRADAFALIGRIAEASTFVRVADLGDGAATGDRARVVIDVVTGMLDDETAFASHGHTVRLRITAR